MSIYLFGIVYRNDDFSQAKFGCISTNIVVNATMMMMMLLMPWFRMCLSSCHIVVIHLKIKTFALINMFTGN